MVDVIQVCITTFIVVCIWPIMGHMYGYNVIIIIIIIIIIVIALQLAAEGLLQGVTA